MHNLYLIVGRTASGKDTLTRMFAEKHGYNILSSYATRPKRPGETNEHIFINKEDVHKYQNDFVAYTKIGEYEYFATKQQLEHCDFYIIDPAGVQYLKNAIGDSANINLITIYIASDYTTRKARAINGRKDKIHIFDERCRKEDAQFTQFEINQDWDCRIENTNLNVAFEQFEKYILNTAEMEEKSNES